MHQGKFESIQERLGKRLVDWGEQYMSTGDKGILIKSVAQAILSYAILVFKLPKGIYRTITHELAGFWWGDLSLQLGVA